MNLASLPIGEHRLPCPACDRGPRDKTLSVTVYDDRAVWHCYRCHDKGAERRGDAPRLRLRPPAPRPAPAAPAGLSDYARDLWASTRRLSGEAVAYLQAREVALPPPDSDLRWTPSLRHPIDGFDGPALVALVRDAVTGEPITLHRTFIAPDGTKRGTPPRLLLRGHRKAGGVVMLWASEAVTHGLGIAEGIETALALAHAHSPVWACIDAGNLAAFPVLPGIESLVIAADGDDAGRAAAASCATRWREHAEVTVVDAGDGTDLADVARGAA